MEKLNTDSKNKTQSWLWHRSSVPHCKIRFKPLGHLGLILNQIPYEYRVEVMNRFKA